MSKRESDLCKGIAILIMFFHHLFYDMNFWEKYEVISNPFSHKQLAAFAQLGKVCVAFFVFLSGYGTAKQYKERKIIESDKIKEYTFLRYFRMIFHYWFIFILSIGFSIFAMNIDLGQDLWKFYGGSNSLVLFLRNILVDFLGIANIRNTPTLCSTWWYMSYGILLVFLMPVLISFVRRYGGMIAIALGFLLIPFLGISQGETFGCYILSVLFGIVCAEYGLFEQFREYVSDNKMRNIISGIVILNMIYDLFYVRYNIGLMYVIDALLAMLICVFVSIWLSRITILSKGIMAFGRYEYTIFLTHTFIRKYYFSDFIYCWKYPIIMYCMLAVSSLFLAIVIEVLKKLLHINELMKLLQDKLLHSIGQGKVYNMKMEN